MDVASLWSLPGGVEEYLRLAAAAVPTSSRTAAAVPAGGAGIPRSTGAELRAAQKELAALERRLDRLHEQVDQARAALADHDQSDYVGIAERVGAIDDLLAEAAQVEQRWDAVSETIA